MNFGYSVGFLRSIIFKRSFSLKRNNEALSLYAAIFRTANKWEAATGSKSDTAKEKMYIKEEARHLFRKNKNVNNPDEIKEFLKEAKSRLDLAVHYQNPYPRPVNLPPRSLGMQKIEGDSTILKKTRRNLKDSVPAYLKSYKHNT